MLKLFLLLVNLTAGLVTVISMAAIDRTSPWFGLVGGSYLVLLTLHACTHLDHCERMTRMETNFDELAAERGNRRQAMLQAAVDESETYGGPTCP